MSLTEDDILALTKQLLPTGQAFRAGEGTNMELLLKALAINRGQAYDASISFLDALIPDNDGFTEDDADDWIRRLALNVSAGASFDEKKAAVLRKMKAPGRNPAKGHYLWLQQQLQDAGFSVWVYENIFANYPSGYIRKNPAQVNSGILTTMEHGVFEHGEIEHGSYFNYIIANSLINEDDVALFNNMTDFGASFFIGGPTIGTYATVPLIREQEFRHLVLQLKQSQNIVFGFINFT